MRYLRLGSAALVMVVAGTASAQTAPPTSPTGGSASTTDAPTDPQNGRSATSSETPSVGSANADQSGAAVAAATPPDGARGLGDIIVTAQRREESLQRAAVSVNVARGADLIAAGITEPYRLSELSPGLTIQPNATGNLIFVRGVGNLTTTPSGDPAIAFNYDGVYVGRPAGTNGLFFDLDRIEVLKGPQGTLYGRNATGGAINVIPTQPKLGELSGYLNGTYGNYNTFLLEGAINAPLGDKGALRVSGSVAQHDGYLRDGTFDNDTKSLRVQLKAELTPNLTVRLAGDYNHLGGASFNGTLIGSYLQTAAGNAFLPSGLSLAEGGASPAALAYRTSLNAGSAKRPFATGEPYPSHSDNTYGANAQIDWNVGFGTLTVIPAFRFTSQNDLFETGDLFGQRTRETDEQHSVEARLTGKRIGIFDYVLGGFYYDEHINSKVNINVQYLATFPGPNIFNTQSLAPFARLTAHVFDRLRVVGGVRYTKDTKTFVGTTTAFQIVCVAPSCPTVPLLPIVDFYTSYPFPVPAAAGAIPYAPGAVLVRGGTRNDNSRLSNDRVTYHGGLEFDLAPQSLLYGTVESAYRSGGFSPATGFETYQPEFITAYTVGSKNRFLNNRVQLNAEGYLWNYTNQQISHVGVDLSGRPANFTQNVGKSRIKGAEVEARVLVTPTTLVSADVQYLDARYLNFSYNQLFTGTVPLNGCANTVAGTQVTVNCSGKSSINAPKWTINLGGQQTIPVGNSYRFVAGVDSQHQSSRYVAFDYLPQDLVRANWTTNAQLLFGPKDDRWSIAGFVRNIENERVVNSVTLVPTTTILIAGTNAPRTYGVRASVKF